MNEDEDDGRNGLDQPKRDETNSRQGKVGVHLKISIRLAKF